MLKAILFDTETTGLPKAMAVPLEQHPRIIELGAMVVSFDDTTVQVDAELTQLISIGDEPVPEKITKITGIKQEDLVGMPTFGEYFNQLKNFFGDDIDFLICHNASFDTYMLKNAIARYNKSLRGMASPTPFDIIWPPEIICTVQEYKSLIGKWPKMTELYLKIMGKELPQKHRALDDCQALHEILVKDAFYQKLYTGGLC